MTPEDNERQWRTTTEIAQKIRTETIEECARWLEDMPEHGRTLAADMRLALIGN